MNELVRMISEDGTLYGLALNSTEMVKEMHMEHLVDRSFYDKLANDAIEAISNVGDYEWFVSDDPYIPAPFAGGKIIK